MNREVKIGPFVRALVLLQAVLTAGVVAWACANDQAIYAAVGMVTLLIMISPFLIIKKYDLFCPWTFALLAVGILATPQAVCTSFNFPSAESIDQMMLLGKDPEYFLYPAIVYLLGWACLTFGYFGFQNLSVRSVKISRDFSKKNATIVLGLSLLVSLVATAAYMQVTGAGSSTQISSKRTTIETLDVGASDQRQHGYLRYFGKLSAVSFLVVYSYLLTRREKLSILETSVVVIAFVSACVFPFYSSSRAQVCWVILYGLGINYYLRPNNFRKKVVVVGLLGMALFISMSFLRASERSEAIENASLAASFEKVILNRNGPGFSKTAQIINHIPEPLDFQLGKTIAVWFLAPIPRELYPDKPLIHTGPIIGTTIYSTRVSGVPPGLIAELYWNFHIPGVIFGMFLMGFSMNRIYSHFRSYDLSPGIVVPVYLFAVTPIMFKALSNSLGVGVVMQSLDLFTIVTVIFFCTQPVAFLRSSNELQTLPA